MGLFNGGGLFNGMAPSGGVTSEAVQLHALTPFGAPAYSPLHYRFGGATTIGPGLLGPRDKGHDAPRTLQRDWCQHCDDNNITSHHHHPVALLAQLLYYSD